MRLKLKLIVATFWSRPDPLLAGAGAAGELLVAKIRLSLATILLLIPLLDALFFPVNHDEAIIGLGLATGTFLFSALIYFLVVRDFNPWWLSFFSSGYDVTQISATLLLFVLLHHPHTAVNSKIVFEGYFLAIGSASLRYDKRVCVTAGILALSQYFGIVFYAATKWDLNGLAFSPFPYGMFRWSDIIGRLIMMLTACALSIAIVSRSQRLLRLATIDPVTGLCNRGFVDERLASELGRARRYRTPLTIAVIDVDSFKLFNDTHGHAAGDLALSTIGATLRASFRQSDTAGRYGGEEFVVIMPETDIETARRKLESVRALIAQTPLELKSQSDGARITISAGLAGFPHDGENQVDLYTLADERLFQAKREGRNRVVANPEVVLV